MKKHLGDEAEIQASSDAGKGASDCSKGAREVSYPIPLQTLCQGFDRVTRTRISTGAIELDETRVNSLGDCVSVHLATRSCYPSRKNMRERLSRSVQGTDLAQREVDVLPFSKPLRISEFPRTRPLVL